MSLATFPHAIITHETYLEELKENLVAVVVADKAVLRSLVNSLVFKRKYPYGRVYMRSRDVNGLFGMLETLDRLVPSSCMPDICALEDVVLPSVIWFLRVKETSNINAVSSLWHVEGVHEWGVDHMTKDRMIGDILHTFDLGIIQKQTGLCFWRILQSEVFSSTQTLRAEMLEDKLKKLRMRLRREYTRQRLSRPQHALSRIDKLTLKMLGPEEDPDLQAKGGESRDAFKACCKMVEEYAPRLHEGLHLLRANRCLSDWLHISETSHRDMSVAERQRLLEAYLGHLDAYFAAGGEARPKHHKGLHMTIKTAYFGNMVFGSTYEDESANGLDALIAKRCKPCNFECSFFFRKACLRHASS